MISFVGFSLDFGVSIPFSDAILQNVMEAQLVKHVLTHRYMTL